MNKTYKDAETELPAVIEFKVYPSNEGFQELVFKNKSLHVIVRNQQRQSRERKKYKITVQEIT